MSNLEALPGRTGPSLWWLQRGDEGYGVSATVTSFSVSLRRRGWDVEVVCLQDGALANSARQSDIPVRILDLSLPPRAISGSMARRAVLLAESVSWARRSGARVRAEISKGGPTVVQTMNVLLLDVLGNACAGRRTLAIWRMASGISDRRFSRLTRWLVRRKCDRWNVVNIANSDWTRRSLGRHSERSLAVLHGCDEERFSPERVTARRRADFGIPRDAVVFAIVARLSSNGNKGQIDVLNGLALFLEKSPREIDIHLLLIGGSPQGSNPTSRAIESFESMPGMHVHSTGQVDDVERYYPMIDVAVNARRDAEPFGLSVIEALMMGVPVLAHALGGPVETIRDRETGWLQDDNSPNGWAEAFARVIADRPRWPDMSLAARRDALARFTVEREVDRWLTAVDGFDGSRELDNPDDVT